MIKSYKDLETWKKSVELVKDIYIITKDFPKSDYCWEIRLFRKREVKSILKRDGCNGQDDQRIDQKVINRMNNV